MSPSKASHVQGWPYRHPLLEDATRQIRLLTFLKVESGLLSFSLTTVNLDSQNDYLALSYEWGAETANEIVLVNEWKTKIRPSLYSFLLQNVKTLHRKQIFIDAICIDQSDATEKQAQIGLMGKVYSGAAEVVAWLGARPPLDGETIPLSRLVSEYHKQKSDSIRRALRSEALERLDRVKMKEMEIPPQVKQMLDDLKQEWDLKMTKLRQTLPTANSFPGLEDALRVLEDMEILDLDLWKMSFEATFWTRCWIVQELTLAQTLTLQLGSHTISAEAYLLLTSATLSDEIGFGSFGSMMTRLDPYILDGPLYEIGTDALEASWEAGPRRVRNVLGLRQRFRQMITPPVHFPLHEAVDKTCKQQCSQPHDHIFSLLGIADTSVVADYETELLLLYIYTLTEGIRDLFRGGRILRPEMPWDVPRAFMIAFHFSMTQPAIWIVTSQILKLYESRRGIRAVMHFGLFMSQALWSDSFMLGKMPKPIVFIYLTLLRHFLVFATLVYYALEHTYRRRRGALVPGPGIGDQCLSYLQWETVAKRIFHAVQSEEPLVWKRVDQVLTER